MSTALEWLTHTPANPKLYRRYCGQQLHPSGAAPGSPKVGSWVGSGSGRRRLASRSPRWSSCCSVRRDPTGVVLGQRVDVPVVVCVGCSTEPARCPEQRRRGNCPVFGHGCSTSWSRSWCPAPQIWISWWSRQCRKIGVSARVLGQGGGRARCGASQVPGLDVQRTALPL